VGAPGVAGRAGLACFGFGVGFGAVTTMVGSCVLSGLGAAGLGLAVSPAAGAGVAGAAAAGASLGDGAVCAKAPAQSDEIRNDVEASNRGRNDTDAPCQTNFRDVDVFAQLAMQTGKLRDVKFIFRQSYWLFCARKTLAGDWRELANLV